MKKAIYLLCLLLIAQASYSQIKDSTPKITVHPSISIGIAEGKNASALLLNSGIGLRYKTWQAGVGVGIDEYFLRSIPLYFEAHKNLQSKRATPYVYAAVGTNRPWLKTQEGISDNGGLFYDLGLGYQWPLGAKYGLFFSAGYSYKELSNEQSYPVYCITWPCPEQRQYFHYQLRRLGLKAGISF
jgi:hypothetical protein